MKNIYICFILSISFFFATNTNLFAELVIRKIDKTNSPMVSAVVDYMFYDNSGGTIWLKEAYGLYYIKKKQDSVINVLYDSTGRSRELQYLAGYPLFDDYGNIITFHGYDGVFIMDTLTKKITQKFTPETVGDNRLMFSNGGILIDDRLFIKTMILINPKIYYLEYDHTLKKWTFHKNNRIQLPTNLHPHTMDMYKMRNKLHIPCDSGMFVYDPYFPELNLKFFKGFEKLFQRWVIRLGGVTDLAQKVTTYAFMIDRRATIMRVYGEDSVKTWTLPYKLTENIELDTNNEVHWNPYPNITAIDKLKTKYLIGYTLNFTYWSEEEGFKYIPRPPHEVIDTNHWLTKQSLFLKKENELWMGTYGGIYVLNLQELLATRTDNFPFKDSSDVIESEVEVFNQMGIYNIGPTPCSDFIDLDYFMLKGFEDLYIRIYDSSGKEYKNPSYEILSQDGIFRKIRVNLNNTALSSGIYIIKLEEGGKTCFKKFIIQ